MALNTMDLTGKTRIVPQNPSAAWVVYYLDLFPKYTVRLNSPLTSPLTYMIVDHDKKEVILYGE